MKLSIKERKARIIARGEVSGHCHVIVGDDVLIHEELGTTVIEVGKEGAVLRHLIEEEWMKGNELWTGEHNDIKITEGIYDYVQEMNFDPLTKRLESVSD